MTHCSLSSDMENRGKREDERSSSMATSKEPSHIECGYIHSGVALTNEGLLHVGKIILRLPSPTQLWQWTSVPNTNIDCPYPIHILLAHSGLSPTAKGCNPHGRQANTQRLHHCQAPPSHIPTTMLNEMGAHILYNYEDCLKGLTSQPWIVAPYLL